MTPALAVAIGVVASTILDEALSPKKKPIVVHQLVESGALPKNIGEREAIILDLVSKGEAEFNWTTVTTSLGENTAVIPVMSRAMAVHTPFGRLTVSVSFSTAQRIADMIGATMLTSRVSDIIYSQSDMKLPVLNQPSWVLDGSMARTERMVEYSNIIDSKISSAGYSPRLVSNEGKHWVVTSRFFLPPDGTGKEATEGIVGSRHNAANFGWYSKASGSRSPGGQKVIQSIGLAHDKAHVDYSQLAVFMGKTILLNGHTEDSERVARDPYLFGLLTDEGKPLPMLRHPDLTQVA